MNGGERTIVYVTREIERALGADPGPGYRIVSNRTPYAESIAGAFPGAVALAESGGTESLGTGDLLGNEAARALIQQLVSAGRAPLILVFKNTARIEPLARAAGWNLLNPPAALSEKIENKVSQVTWLGDAARHLPRFRIELAKNISWRGEPFILQWAHGHTGDGTQLVSSEAALAAIKEKFPERRARVSAFVNGPSYTVNVVVDRETIASASPSYQITGLKPFTDNAFSTIGNDWSAARQMLAAADHAWIDDLVSELGAKMQKAGWRGLFGIDMMKDASTGRLYLIEINARQPASTTYESCLQRALRTKGATGLTTFEAHLKALAGETLDEPIIAVEEGSQVVQRVTAAVAAAPAAALEALGKAGFRAISYSNTGPNEDLVRIQSDGAVMESHGVLNEKGRMIATLLGGS